MLQTHKLGDRPAFLSWTTLAYLEAAYPGQAVLTVVQTAQALAIAEKSIRNRLAEKCFVIPNAGEPGKPAFRKIDVARYIDEMVAPRKVPRGAPTKGERIAARAAGLSVPEHRAQKGGE